MSGSSPPDARDPDERLRTGDAEFVPDAATTEVHLPTRSTLLLDEEDGAARTSPEVALPPAAEPVSEAPAERRAAEPARPVSRTTFGVSSDSYAAASSLGEESRFSSAIDALRHDEIRRSRLLARFGLTLGAAVAVALPFLAGDPQMTRLAYGAVAVVSLGNLWLYYLSSRPERFVMRDVAIVWIMNSIGVSVGIAYFGIFSAAAFVVLLGVYFMALGQSLVLATFVYATCAAMRGAFAVLILVGAMPDPGIIHPTGVRRDVLLIFEALIQLALFAAFLMARASRQATLSAVTDYERAVRALAQREALLHEARQDLERALRLGGVGRFTGQTLGSFRLGPVLGRGSMGEVYEAVRIPTGEPAAVKLLLPASMGNPSYLMRFLREVEVAAAIEVPHVVRVLEVGNASSPIPYLAMERLRGQDLAQLLRDRRRLPADQVVEMVAQAGRGIAAAAEVGVVHRDLKPQNLFFADQLAGGPIWKVLDFGVSKLIGERGTLTQGQVVGTPVYMAPEQAQGLEVDHSADLYALAAIAYRCLTGHLPFRAKDVPTIMYQVVYKMPIRPSALCSVSPDVDAALLIAMAKNPAHRFATAGELTRALAAGVRGQLSDDLRSRARVLAQAHPWRPGP